MKNIRLPVTQSDLKELYITKYTQEKARTDMLEEVILSMAETIVKRDDEINYLKRRNCELQHGKDLLALRIIELDKKIETLYYNAGE